MPGASFIAQALGLPPLALQATALPAGPVGQWIELMPAGPQMGRDGRGPFRMDDARAVAARSLALAPSGNIPLDYNHAIDLAAPKGGESPAAGWIARLDVRDGGIWGYAEWTPRAAKLISEREYRFISPVLHHDGAGKVLAIARAALVNNPNLTLTALNAAGGDTGADPVSLDLLAELRPLLGLPADADETAILAKAKIALNQNAAVDPARYVPMEMFQKAVSALNTMNAGVSRQAAEIQVKQDLVDRRLMPWMKDWAVDLCMANKPAYDAFMAKAGDKVGAFLDDLTAPSRIAGRPVATKAGGEVDAGIRHQLGISEADISSFGGAPR